MLDTPILGKPKCNWNQAAEWAQSRGALFTCIKLAELYWWLAPATGVRADVAYAQMCKETAFGRFGGVINDSFHNTCGLKTTRGGDNFDPLAHQKFTDWPQGVQAQLDHLGLYAAGPGYPKTDTYDPRHFPYLCGKARTVLALSGNWTGAGYGETLLERYLYPMLNYYTWN